MRHVAYVALSLALALIPLRLLAWIFHGQTKSRAPLKRHCL